MNYPSTELLPNLAATNRSLRQTLQTKIDALRDRLDTFIVVDKHGETVGEVRNLTLDNQRLHLVMVQPDTHKGWRFLLLGSSLVQRISLQERTVFVHTSQTDISYLPEYRAAVHSTKVANHASAHASTSPVNQVPALSAKLPITHVNGVDEASRTGWLTAQKTGAAKAPLLDYPATPKVISDSADTSAAQSHAKKSEPFSQHRPTSYQAFNPVNTSELSTQVDQTIANRVEHGKQAIVNRIDRGIAKPEAASVAQGFATLEASLAPTIALDQSVQPSQNSVTKDESLETSRALTVRGEFDSPKRASEVLDAIAKTLHHHCKTIRIEIELEDETLRDVYQEWLHQYTSTKN